MALDSSQASARRPRNAAATRAAILASARKAFARHGYDGVGLREIAAGAGVTAMLVNRYFGCKEGLFAEVAANSMRDPVILSAANLAAADFPAALAKAITAVTAPDAPPLDGFMILLNSIASPTAGEIGREWIARGHQSTLEGAIGGPLARERAGLVLALVGGLLLMRRMVGVAALAEASPEDLQALLTPVMRALAEANGDPSG